SATARERLAKRTAQSASPARPSVIAPTTAFGIHPLMTNAPIHSTRSGMPRRIPIDLRLAVESGSAGTCLGRAAASASSRACLGVSFFCGGLPEGFKAGVSYHRGAAPGRSLAPERARRRAVSPVQGDAAYWSRVLYTPYPGSDFLSPMP